MKLEQLLLENSRWTDGKPAIFFKQHWIDPLTIQENIVLNEDFTQIIYSKFVPK